MDALIDTLPGVRLPVSDVTATLTRMWQTDLEAGVESPSEFHASQLNLILHFGLETTPEEALERFEVALAFAEIHPARIIVLCPLENVRGAELLEGKLYSRCFIGQTLGEMGCLEALMLSYPTSESGFLENQISIWLESDLPTYHWLHRVPAQPIEEHYRDFMKDFRRVVYDSSVDNDIYDSIAWPRDGLLHDLSFARSLPLRQSIGQFLSRFAPSALCEGLKRVEVSSHRRRLGETHGLLRWQRSCLQACAKSSGDEGISEVEWSAAESTQEGLAGFQGRWVFSDERRKFVWSFQEDSEQACLEANFGEGAIRYPAHVQSLTAEKVLAEAMFG